jgi:hypothetical protein
MMSELEIQGDDERITVFKWKLSNFSTVAARDDPNKELDSGDFQLDFSAIKCYLKFRPTTFNGTDRNASSLFLCVKDFAGQSPIKLRFNLWIENEFDENVAERLSKCF